MPIDSWSHSKLVEFEKCKYRTFLMHVKRVPEPQRELPPGKTEHANDRGSRIHDAAEHFVNGTSKDLPYELGSFEREFLRLRHLYTQGRVSLEGQWGFDEMWEPMPWKGEWREYHAIGSERIEYKKVDALPEYGRKADRLWFKDRGWYWHPCWHRSKLDALVFPNDFSAIVIDYKTGKRWGKEITHGEQTQLYSLDTILRYPKVEEVTTELWYPDIDELHSMTFTRDQVLRFKNNFNKRGIAITTNDEWPANPNIFTCRYCNYGESGDCMVSAKDKFTGVKRK